MQNLADIVTLSGIALAFFLALLVLNKKRKVQADFILIGWLLVMGLHFAYFYISFHKFFDKNVFIQTVGSSLPIFHAPLIYLYIVALSKKVVSLKEIFLSSLPITLYLGAHFYLFHFGYFRADGFTKFINDETPKWIFGLGPIMILVNLFFVIVLLKVLNAHRKQIDSNFSFQNKITLKWVQYWVLSFIVSAILISLSIIFSDLGKISETLAFTITSMSMLIQLLIIAQFGLQQTTAFINQNYYSIIDESEKSKQQTEKTVSKYAKSGLHDEQITTLSKKLKNLMEADKPFLNPELTLPDLAKLINIPTYQLSQIINDSLSMNFFDFVNQYRVEEVKKLLKDASKNNLTILAVAFESGFSSKSAFNKAFKKFTGTTPSAFKKSH